MWYMWRRSRSSLRIVQSALFHWHRFQKFPNSWVEHRQGVFPTKPDLYPANIISSRCARLMHPSLCLCLKFCGFGTCFRSQSQPGFHACLGYFLVLTLKWDQENSEKGKSLFFSELQSKWTHVKKFFYSRMIHLWLYIKHNVIRDIFLCALWA